MRCRNCGHDNERSTEKCGNCGFDLGPQTDPRKDQRAALQKALDTGIKKAPVLDLSSPSSGKAGVIGFMVFLIGAIGAIFIISSFDRAEYEPETEVSTEDIEVEIPVDSLPLMLGTDIVYVFNSEGTSASPRTNIDLALIPEGTTVSFLGSSSMSIQPVVNYMQQKINSSDMRVLTPDSLYAWVDSTETEYISVSILKPVPSAEIDSTVVQPVDVKILFTDQWVRCMIDEYNKDIIEAAGGYRFDERLFTSVMNQAERTLTRRNTDLRPVHITLLFPSESSFGEAMEIAGAVSLVTDSLGYEGFHIKWVNVTD